MAQMAPVPETIDPTRFKSCHMNGFYMAPHGTTWRSAAVKCAIRKVAPSRMALFKSFSFNSGAICAMCAI